VAEVPLFCLQKMSIKAEKLGIIVEAAVSRRKEKGRKK